MALLQIQSTHLLVHRFEKSKKITSNILANVEDYIQSEFLRLIPKLTPDSFVSHLSFVLLQSSRLCIGAYILLQYDDIRPVFGKIVDIVCYNDTVLLCVQEYYGHYINSHYNIALPSTTTAFLRMCF